MYQFYCLKRRKSLVVLTNIFLLSAIVSSHALVKFDHKIQALNSSMDTKPYSAPKIKGPWFTGTLISASGVTTPPGEYDIEPFLFLAKTYSAPDVFSINPALLFYYGLGKRVDLQTYIPYIFSKAESTNKWVNSFQDITVKLGIQAVKSPQNSWVPNIRLIFSETFPSGKHEQLDPFLFSADSTGGGSYNTGVGANLQQVYLLPNGYYLRLRLNLLFSIPTSTLVHGHDSYGGGIGTYGDVTPGNIFFGDFAFEYTLSQNWVLAMDTVYNYQDRTYFRGDPGFNADGSRASVGGPPSNQVSLVPSLEYNFNGNLGVIAGVWFSVYSHNINNFIAGVIAVNYASW